MASKQHLGLAKLATYRAAPGLARPLDLVGAIGRLREADLVVCFGLVALLLRLPRLFNIPIFTDEVDDVYRALLISRGELLPLTDTSSYIGSLWDFLMAGALWVSHDDARAPRLLVMLFGTGTVLATYLLGRAWGGRAVGLLTLALMSTSASHIVVNSHIAWANCLTPFFTTLALWSLYETVQNTRFRPSTGLLLSGLFGGLAVQTHPTALALLPGAGLFLLLRRPTLLRTVWPYLATLLLLLVNTNLLVHNLSTNFDSVAQGVEVAAIYTHQETLTPLVYAGRLVWLLLGLARHLSGALAHGTIETLAVFIFDPGLWPITLLALAGLVLQWRRGNPLPVLLTVGLVAVLPLFDRSFASMQASVQAGRYLTPLLPVLYASVAMLLVASARAIDRLDGRVRPDRAALVWLAKPALAVAVLYLALHPLLYLQRYYEQEERLGRTNQVVDQALNLIRTHRNQDDVVLLDQPVRQRSVGPGGGTVPSIVRTALALERVPFRLVDLDQDGLPPDLAERCDDLLVVLANRRPDSVQTLLSRIELLPLDSIAPPDWLKPTTFAVFVLPPSSDLSPACPV